MAYQVTIKKRAIKALIKIREPYYANIKKAIYNLEENPRPTGCKKLKGRNAYRIRIADYRVIYEIIDSELVVDIIEIGDRKDVFR